MSLVFRSVDDNNTNVSLYNSLQFTPNKYEITGKNRSDKGLFTEASR